MDFGGIGVVSEDESNEDVGIEFDATLNYACRKNMHFQLVYAAFIPGKAYTEGREDSVTQEVRAGLRVWF